MGLLPGQTTLGPMAAVLMVALRLIQGFSLGGELPGAITFVVENAPRNAGFAAGFVFFCVGPGVALASALQSCRARGARGAADRRLGMACRVSVRRRTGIGELLAAPVTARNPRISASAQHPPRSASPSWSCPRPTPRRLLTGISRHGGDQRRIQRAAVRHARVSAPSPCR